MVFMDKKVEREVEVEMPPPSSSGKTPKKTGSCYELQIMTIDKEISVDAPIAPVLSELDSIFTLLLH